MLVRVKRSGNMLYVIHLNITKPVCVLARSGDTAWQWHARFGNLHFSALHDLGTKGMVSGMTTVDQVHQVRSGCTIGKMHRKPFPATSTYRAEQPLELFHGDLCKPISPATTVGNRYFLLIVDDYNRYMWVEMLCTNGQALEYVRKIKPISENDHGLKLLAFRSDRGGEFNSKAFTSLCNEARVKRYTTAPYSPQQNGVVEGLNQMVVEMARCLLKGMNAPPYFLGRGGRDGSAHTESVAGTRAGWSHAV